VNRDERGAVAVIVAICAVVIFGFAAYSIDAGRLWTSRRHLVTTADAAALAGAKDYALGQAGCSSAVPTYVTANHPGATLVSCTPVVQDSTRGYVTVQAKASVDFSFAKIFGFTARDVHGTTTAQWGIPKSVGSLRPFGLCIDASDQLRQWLADPTGSSDVIRITYGKSQPDACGSVPGNWGVQDFDGGANSNADTVNWTLHGYHGVVGVGDDIPGDTGAFSNSLNDGLSYLKDSGEAFALPVFDTAVGDGSNASFHVVAFVFVRLVDFKTTGAQADRYLDLVFTRGVVSGICCAANGIDTGVRAIRICDVNTLTPNTSDPRAC
jgi:Flp pilus assembly protein TadG